VTNVRPPASFPQFSLLCAFVFTPLSGSAGRPFFTDDARLTEAQACQLELWWHAAPDVHEGWVLPACNPLGNFELTFGVTTFENDGTDRTDSVVLQGKTLLRPLETGNYGIGFAAGVSRANEGGAGTDYAYLPVSVLSGTGATTVHVNLGCLHDRERESTRTTWGVGIGHDLTERLFAFAEVFDSTDPTVHGGFSFRVIPDRLHLDVTYGRTVADSDRFAFYTVGVSIYFAAIGTTSN